VTIAKNVKIQVEFNPQRAESYRLIGYENRALRHQDFTDDRKDAGDIGAGHTVTALYEVVPRGAGAPEAARGSMLRYQRSAEPTQQAHSNELLVVKLRYKKPDGDRSRELQFPVEDEPQPFNSTSNDMRFAAAVVSFGMLLRGSEHKGTSSFASVLAMASDASGSDPYRQEFLSLVRKAQSLGPRR
jgi:Ca-activated chloride channel family protein